MLSALRKIGIVAAVVVLFLFGLVGTVYLSLRTKEVKVPDITGKDRYSAEQMLENAGLKMRVRGTKPSASKPDVVLNQVPEAGLAVKEGIPVTVQVSRLPKEGEGVPTAEEAQQENANKPTENANANQTSSTNQNQNQSQNQNKPKNKNKNSNNANKNSNNSNNANKANQNRNATSSNMSTNRNANARNANTLPNVNRTTTNPNANRRPVITTPPFNPGANRRTP